MKWLRKRKKAEIREVPGHAVTTSSGGFIVSEYDLKCECGWTSFAIGYDEAKASWVEHQASAQPRIRSDAGGES